MPGFFEALANFKPKERPKPVVTVQGKQFEVTPELFKEITSHGEDQYEVIDGKITRKPIPKFQGKSYEVLKKADKGYTFIEGDPYWPHEYKEGGFAWQTESE